MKKICKSKEQLWGSLHVPLHAIVKANQHVTTCVAIRTFSFQKLHLSVEKTTVEKLIELPKVVRANHEDEPHHSFPG